MKRRCPVGVGGVSFFGLQQSSTHITGQQQLHDLHPEKTHLIISVICLQSLFLIKGRRFLPQLCQTRRPGPAGFSLHCLQYTGWTGAAAASPTADR